MAVFKREVNLVWQIRDAENYKFDLLGNCYNMKTSKQLKRNIPTNRVGNHTHIICMVDYLPRHGSEKRKRMQ